MSFEERLLGLINEAIQRSQTEGPAVLNKLHADLSQIENENFPQYLHALSQFINMENVALPVKQQIALIMKNVFRGDAADIKEMKVNRWCSLDDNLKMSVRKNIYEALSQPRPVSTAAAQVLSEVGIIDIEKGLWPDLPKILCNNVIEAQNIVHPSLQALGFICENIDTDTIADDSELILSAFVSALLRNDNELKITALSGLGHILYLCEKNFNNPADMGRIMSLLFQSCEDQDDMVAEQAYKVLVSITSTYYDNLQPFIVKMLEMTLQAIKTADEAVAKMALEIWSTIAEVELKRAANHVNYSGFTKGAFKHLIPHLFAAITKFDDPNYDPNEVTLPISACICLNFIAKTVKQDIIEPLWPYINSNIASSEWNVREAALLALGAILEAPTQAVQQIVITAIPTLIDIIKDYPVTSVKDSAAWNIGQIYKLHPQPVQQSADEMIGFMLNVIRNAESRLAANACFAIQMISEAPYQPNPIINHFRSAVDTLYSTAKRQDSSEFGLRLNACETLNSIISQAPMNETHLLLQMLDVVLKDIESTIGQQGPDVVDTQELLCGMLQSLHSKTSPVFVDQASKTDHSQIQNLMESFFIPRTVRDIIEILKSPTGYQVAEEAMLTVSRLVLVLGDHFKPFIPQLLPFIFEALKRITDSSTCSVAVGIISDIGPDNMDLLQNDLPALLDHFYVMIASPDVSYTIKPSVLLCIADLASAGGDQFLSQLEGTLNMLQMLTEIVVETKDIDPTDTELINYTNDLREAMLYTYNIIINIISDCQNPQMRQNLTNNLLKNQLVYVIQICNHVAEDRFVNESLAYCALGCLYDYVSLFKTYLQGKIPNSVKDFVQSAGSRFNNNPELKKLASHTNQAIRSL